MTLFFAFLFLAILPMNYMGDVTSPGEFCLLLDGVIPDPHGSDEKLKNPNGEVTAQLVVGVFINSSVLLVALSVS